MSALLLPWRVLRQREELDYLEIADETGLRQMAEIGGCDRAERAAFIVKAVNAHDDLVRALRAAREYIAHDTTAPVSDDLLEKIAVAFSHIPHERKADQ